MDIQAGKRVRIANQSLEWYRKCGTVMTVDSEGRIWVRIDGFRKAFPFFESDLSTLPVAASPLAYGKEPTTNPFKQRSEE